MLHFLNSCNTDFLMHYEECFDVVIETCARFGLIIVKAFFTDCTLGMMMMIYVSCAVFNNCCAVGSGKTDKAIIHRCQSERDRKNSTRD